MTIQNNEPMTLTDNTIVKNSEQSIGERLIPINDWPQYHPWPSISGLRYFIFHANTNGFHKVIRRVGRRVLIKESAFFDWVDEQNNSAELR